MASGYVEVHKVRLACRDRMADFAARLRIESRIRARHRETGKALRRALKADRSISFRRLGYTSEDLRVHLERQFRRGMTWAKFMAGQIHIDHRVPLSAFNLGDDLEFKAAWAMTNLQPLWAVDNVKKAADRSLLL